MYLLWDQETESDDWWAIVLALKIWAKLIVSVKHETRIRTLETKNKEQEKMLVSKGILLNNNGHNDLDPDEVWGEKNINNQDIHTSSRYDTPSIACSNHDLNLRLFSESDDSG